MSASALLRLVRKKAVFLYGLAKNWIWYGKRPFFCTDWQKSTVGTEKGRFSVRIGGSSWESMRNRKNLPQKNKKSLPQKSRKAPRKKNKKTLPQKKEKPPAKIKKILPHPLPQKIPAKNFNNPLEKLCRGRKFGYICMLLNL